MSGFNLCKIGTRYPIPMTFSVVSEQVETNSSVDDTQQLSPLSSVPSTPSTASSATTPLLELSEFHSSLDSHRVTIEKKSDPEPGSYWMCVEGGKNKIEFITAGQPPIMVSLHEGDRLKVYNHLDAEIINTLCDPFLRRIKEQESKQRWPTDGKLEVKLTLNFNPSISVSYKCRDETWPETLRRWSHCRPSRSTIVEDSEVSHAKID